MPPWVILGHAGLAVGGLCIWIAYTITSATALAWTDVGLTAVIAGLGMATLLAAIPEQLDSGSVAVASVESAGGGSAPFPARAPVITIALHGVLATLTILLVLLAAVGPANAGRRRPAQSSLEVAQMLMPASTAC